MDIRVAAACIVWRNNNKKEVGLIHRRNDYPHHLSGKWFFPGGIIEDNEQPFESAMRETKEECGLSVSNLQLIDTYAYTEYRKDNDGVDREQRVVLVIYEAICTDDKELSNSGETQNSAWVPLAEIKNYLTADTVSTHTSKAVRELLGL